MDSQKIDQVLLTSDIVSAYVSGNETPIEKLPALIETVFRSLSSLGSTSSMLGERPQPAISPKKSVSPDYIVCLEDGRKLKMLKRHLKTAYNMTPDEYRIRWNLPHDYPMVAPNYAERRSNLAKKIGLGTNRRKAK
ncbi:MAG TPA: MucR family transcriptional regulator [Rhodospirillaceae bacterium]|nr:MAG: MucR family transcriptional regulator [Alphaproteobacteria bacterium GWF2_58_20]HAU29274.1 MucR family transcriptional regulator [Rhodospirillaceae bacterium]